MVLEDLTFGVDLGIGSCGWAVLRRNSSDQEAGAVVAAGSWMFDIPETAKERTPTNQIRRANRLLRRVIRRRRNRMSELRRLFHQNGLLPSAEPDALRSPGLDPWEMRARGLEAVLSPVEFAVALGHIAKHRGFRSAAKRKDQNAVSDDKKMLSAIETTREKIARYGTIGALFARDPEFAARKRNRDGVYDRTASRDDLGDEVRMLFASQRRYGLACASPAIEADYRAIAFSQRPLQDSEQLVGLCGLEPADKRAAKHAPSFEMFRLLTRLVNLKVSSPEGERRLTPCELALATSQHGRTAKLAIRRVRDLIGLADEQRFIGIKPDREGDDIAVRTGEAMAGTYGLRKALGDCWESVAAQPGLLDDVAHCLSFFETNETIAGRLQSLGLGSDALKRLLAALETGAFARFKGAGHISAKAARAMLPHLLAGYRYDEAASLAGYDHAASLTSRMKQVTDKVGFRQVQAELSDAVSNPIARKAMGEGLKQLWAMRNQFGLPGAIHIELARDVGLGLEKRREIESAIDKTTAERDRQRNEIRSLLAIDDVSGDTLLRYRLWKEQNGRCLYTDTEIRIEQIIGTDNSVQVDHILPWSRFGDDSFNNKTLCLAGANQRKKRNTPYEWINDQSNPQAWESFVQRVETNKSLRGFKKRNYLLKNADEAAERFRSRNLNDTRYAARLLAEAVKLFYPLGERQERDGIRRVFTRPGALTSVLRHAWGLESLKKIDGKRVSDDRHHALDALVVAAVSEAEIQRLTRSFQEWEQRGLGRKLRQVDQPWLGFRDHAKQTIFGDGVTGGIVVARSERRRARGEGHAATIRQVCVAEDGKTIVYERKSVLTLKETDLSRVKDPERNTALIESLRAWIASGRKTSELPRSPAGDVIAKVRLSTDKKLAVPMREGTADRGDMVRVDLFSRPNKRGKPEWYLVPIYPHQAMNPRAWPSPPMHAVVAHKGEAEWTPIDEGFLFRFSLYPRSYVEVLKSDGEIVAGYFQGLDRSVGAIGIFKAHNPRAVKTGIGAKTLVSIRKMGVDRMGRLSEIKNEVRTWHGAVFTSPDPHV